MEEPFRNRRKHRRIYRNFIVHCRPKGTTMNHEICQTHDISKGGASFSSTVLFDTGTVLNLELQTPFLNHSVFLDGVVLAHTVKIVGLIYRIHIQWVNLTENSEDILAKIEQFSAQ